MNKYDKCLALAKEQGLFLDDRIERRQKNGLYGMYATEDIPKGTVIASFPRSSLLPEPDKASYSMPLTKWPLSLAREIQKGQDSSFQAHKMMLETKEELRQHSLYYFSDDEKRLLFEMSPILGNAINDFLYETNSILEEIKKAAPEVTEDNAIQAILNSYSRVWGSLGILPVIDLFNHSETKGVTVIGIEDDSLAGIVLDEDYKAGQQIWISYGRKDLLSYAINYNYFDSSNRHIIEYAKRAIQVLDTPEKLEIAEFISKHYAAVIFEYQGQKKMTLEETDLDNLESRPSQKLAEYFLKTGFTTMQEFKLKQGSPLSAAITYLGVINAFLSANKVDNYKLTQLPPKLHRFHQALKKEKKMLLANKEWAEEQVKNLKH